MSTKSYEVAAPLVVIKDGEGRDRYLYKGAAVPADVDTKHRDQLVDEGLLVEAKASTTKTSTSSTSSSNDAYTEGADPAGYSIPKLQAYVGDDAEKAAAVLELEQARGDDARSSLVKQLEAIANPSSDNS